jgi:hypothetical protein
MALTVPERPQSGGQRIGIVAATACTGQPTISESRKRSDKFNCRSSLADEKEQLAKFQLEYYQLSLQTKKAAEQFRSANLLNSNSRFDYHQSSSKPLSWITLQGGTEHIVQFEPYEQKLD